MSSHATEHDGTTADQGDQGDPTGMTADEKRHDQLTRAPKSDETDAAPRITTEERPDGVTRIDVADTAKVRPGGGEAHTRD